MELITLAPACVERWGIGDAFRQSLIWRAYDAIFYETRTILNQLIRNRHDEDDTCDVLLTVASLPEHPFNAQFLDENLRRFAMADRDAWWSTYLHRAWRAGGAVDRLVDWAWSVSPGTPIDAPAVELCAVALSWMLTTSNRFLRDRASKALVNLLTGRIEAVVRLVDQFDDVDDPYVRERIYAVAYGVAMRSHDSDTIGALAERVYDRVFASDSPPPHILLRDYARGVVERALYLRCPIHVNLKRVRPPYKSTWPDIPTDDEVKPFLPDWSKGDHDSRQVEWARNRIGSSIMSDDFGRYVIGTNHSSTSREWLSVTLDEPRWQPPPSPQEQLRSFREGLATTVQHDAVDRFEEADREYAFASIRIGFTALRTANERAGEGSDVSASSEGAVDVRLADMKLKRSQALSDLESLLEDEQKARLHQILESRSSHQRRQPPGLELGWIQRYVLRRVFELGWTTDRFGEFDRFMIGYQGRDAKKAERIGKKYQWIAYHEILAFVSDRFQYREPYRDDKGRRDYEGPWQDHLRNIDPSCTLRAVPGGTTWDGHSPSWWGPTRFDAWGAPGKQREWVLDQDNIPAIEGLLTVSDPSDGTVWINADGYFNWKQPTPADRESIDVERREIWYMTTGYLVRAGEAESFMQWAETVDFWNRWMPDAPEVYKMFLGEHPWSPASHYFRQEYYGDAGWTQPGHGCPVQIRTIPLEYLNESSGFDCSGDDGYKLHLAASEVLEGLGARWTARGADYADSEGRVVAQDPTVHGTGPSALVLREDVTRDYLAREGLAIVWAVLGEKRVLSGGLGDGPHYPSIRMTGAYLLSAGKAQGFTKLLLDEPGREPEVLGVRRTLL